MRKRSHQRAATNLHAAMEPLTQRLLLSAKLIGSTLKIVGTDEADAVVVAANGRFVNMLSVTLNGDVQYFALSAVTRIDIRTFAGDDKIWIDSTLDPMAYGSFVDAGAGNDSVTGGAGRDRVLAGEGNDKVYANAGNDSIDGGAGKDLLTGGGGDDVIASGVGDDRVDAGEGNDTLTNDAGKDAIYAGAGDDVGRFSGGGVVQGGEGNDTLVSTGGSLLFGDAGNDNLQASALDGGSGDDTLSGLLGDDSIAGGDGNDLIRGFAGRDLLNGDAGNDAIFGGVDADTLHGGDGKDNLYGTDGAADKHKDLAGRDDGFGDDGSDWFETSYRWGDTDRGNSIDRPVNAQNALGQDPSVGLYLAGNFTSDNNLNSGPTTLWFEDGVTTGKNPGSGSFTINNPVVVVPQLPWSTLNIVPVGGVGWLSNGAYDTPNQRFVPPPMSYKQRTSIGRAVLQLPAGWKIGEMSFARDDLVWYSISANAIVPKQSSYVVPALGGGTVDVPYSTPHLLDGVNDGAYRFLGVKRGTILVSSAGQATEPIAYGLADRLLPLPVGGDIRLAGYDSVYHPPTRSDSVPVGGPKALKGILVDGGAIWLPTDGSAPYFSSGKN
jgi:hypothetical protein